ncbi:MAG: TIGR00341 family protein [Gammaproteobacteria bacterium]|nr:TIGR00341 family protein [Gammaproteobacteria bacterium]
MALALALGTTLGDLSMLRRALFTEFAGIITAMLLSAIIGALVHVDPTVPEVVLRTTIGWGDIAVALASGCAGALAFTTGVSATLIGVMVAVALLPPLVTFGLLLGSGYPVFAIGALSLFFMKLICVNIAGVAMFLVQGIHPLSWWEKNLATKATRIAIVLWIMLLATLFILIMLLKKI